MRPKEGITIGPQGTQPARRQIAMRFKAGIARNMWGNDGYYRILLDKDSMYLKALGPAGSGRTPREPEHARRPC
jgi:hypothetical protein